LRSANSGFQASVFGGTFFALTKSVRTHPLLEGFHGAEADPEVKSKSMAVASAMDLNFMTGHKPVPREIRSSRTHHAEMRAGWSNGCLAGAWSTA